MCDNTSSFHKSIFKRHFFAIIFSFLKNYLFTFRQRGRVGEREGEKHQCVVASYMPLMGTWSETQARALTGNQTGDPLVHRLVLNPLSHTSQVYLHPNKI